MGGINAEVPGRGPGQPGNQVGAGAGLSSAVEKDVNFWKSNEIQ